MNFYDKTYDTTEDKLLFFLCTTGHELSSFRDADNLIEKAASISKQILRAKSSLIILSKDEKKEVYSEDSSGKIIKIKLKDNDSIEIFPDSIILNKSVDSFNWAKYIMQLVTVRIRNLISSPILWENEVLGQLIVINKDKEEDFTENDKNILKILSNQFGIAISNVQNMESLQNFFVHMIEVMVMAIESISTVPEGHCMDVARIATALARQLNVNEKNYENIYYAALIHDIGKIKTQGLVPSQAEKIHPILGAEMLYPINLLAKVAPLVAAHHEFYDGSGFPKGLSGAELSISSQIVGISENFKEWQEDMMMRRFQQDVENYLAEVKGKYHPDILNAFDSIKDRFRLRKEVGNN